METTLNTICGNCTDIEFRNSGFEGLRSRV